MYDPSTPSELESLSIKYRIEEITGAQFSKDNRVQLLKSGYETFRKIHACISAAKNIICAEFYIFKDDDTGKIISEILKEKSLQGVKVYLLYDHFGSFLTSRDFWQDLKKAGVKLRASHPFKWSSPRRYIYRNHKKLLIIDGEKAFTGGFNIADEYHGYWKKKILWKDTGIYLEGPIASTLLSIFRESWATWGGEPISFNSNAPKPAAQGVPVIPIFARSGRARRKMRRLFIHSITHAKRSIYITTAYFMPGRRILKMLERAAQRGVDLRILLPSQADVTSINYAGKAYYKRLLKAGVKIYNYQDAVLHSKTAVFDGAWSIAGSTNLDFQSLRRNEESNVGILDMDFGKKMTQAFQEDLRHSVRIDAETWNNRPFHQKLLEKFFSLIMRKLLS